MGDLSRTQAQRAACARRMARALDRLIEQVLRDAYDGADLPDEAGPERAEEAWQVVSGTSVYPGPVVGAVWLSVLEAATDSGTGLYVLCGLAANAKRRGLSWEAFRTQMRGLKAASDDAVRSEGGA